MIAKIGWFRIAVGIALIGAPRMLLKAPTGAEPTGSALLLARTIGIRDLVIGAGTLAAVRSGSEDDIRRWAIAALASDALDAVTGIKGVRWVGRRGAAIAAGAALPLVGADLWGLRGYAGRR